MIRKVLIANRGEIAVRIARTCREMGIATVAVYSDADRDAQHVRACDAAYHIGPSPSAESYLVVEAILDAAHKSGADAIHPGFGFLAENAAFSKACTDAGITFIGPSEEAIRVMGSKLLSKKLMKESGVPTIPGTSGDGTDLQSLCDEAKDLKLPLLIKASAGGGGKGMRKVTDMASLKGEMEAAAREAAKAFGDPTLLVEHYVESPRHVEIQVFGDTHGNVVHLFERECSIQRRHQKVIEESPSPALNSELREKMGAAAVAAAASVDYVGAGTVEFILAPDGSFYFLEMNTRLQVEHPVTECVTQQDLVREQILVAEGASLSFTQDELTLTGAAVECRIYAEDPANDFLPATGTLVDFHLPELPGIRLDSGVETGDEVSIYYDPMLAKVIAYGRDRNEANRRMCQALEAMSIQGVVTNRAFLLDVLRHPEYEAGNLDTHFIATHLSDWDREATFPAPHLIAATVVPTELAQRNKTLLPGLISGYRNNPFSPQLVQFEGAAEDEVLSVGYTHTGAGAYQVFLGETTHSVEQVKLDGHELSMVVDGHRTTYRVVRNGQTTYVQCAHHASTLTEVPRFPDPHGTEDEGSCVAPMPGKVVAVYVKEGDSVAKGSPVAAIEAMKMEHQVGAPADGIIAKVLVAAGDQVDAQAPLVVMEADSEES